MADQSVVSGFNRALQRRNPPDVVRKALFASGIVESNLQNLPGGDRDSVGALQQRGQAGWKNAANPERAANDFISAAMRVLKTQPTISSAALSQAVQRSAFPGRYGEHRVQAAAQRYAGLNGSAPASRAGKQTVTTPGTAGSVTPAHEVPDAGVAAEDALLASTKTMDKHLPKVGSGVLAHAAYLLDSGQATRTVGAKYTPGKDAKLTAAPSKSAVGRATGRLEPVGKGNKVIGTPHQGTHTLGNWQSDNAVDISAPVGTPLRALQDGVIVKVKHHPQNGGRFAGDQITVRGVNGNEYFYAHGSSTNVKAGQKVRRGQVIGRSGAANGVAHLHFGQMKGDPREHTG